MSYIQRHSAYARSIHWAHMLATLALFFTGLVLFIPAVAALFTVDAIQALRIVHRGAAVVFIAAPILGAVLNPSGFKKFMGELFAKWDDDDREFMRKFVPYLFNPKKVHMPKQHELKSGQRVADIVMILFAVGIAVSGAVMWAAASFDPAVVRAMFVVHDVSMIMLGVVVLAHAYLGFGIFQPYRGTARLMLGDGKISEADARYHWGHWADEKLGESGEKPAKSA